MTLIVSHREWLAADRRAVIDAANWAEQVFEARKLHRSPCGRFVVCSTGYAFTPDQLTVLFQELTAVLSDFYRGKLNLHKFRPERGSSFWDAVDERRLYVQTHQHRWMIDDKSEDGKDFNYFEEILDENECRFNGSAVASGKAVWLSGYQKPEDIFRITNSMSGECSVEFDICYRAELSPFIFHEE